MKFSLNKIFSFLNPDNKEKMINGLSNVKDNQEMVNSLTTLQNEITVSFNKDKKFFERTYLIIILSIILVGIIASSFFAIEKIKVINAIKKQLAYREITIESIEVIAMTIDAKDHYTNGHSLRVGKYSKLIAQELNLSSDDVDNIYYVALLHDIGKIAIPDSILNKPSRLTDEEFMVMKSHTIRGAEILSSISTIPNITAGARNHHEKYDGSGYPDGLKGEEIPYIARIICCADCFDAMATKRVYKEAFDDNVIKNEFIKWAGIQFDPEIAKVVVKLIEEKKLTPMEEIKNEKDE